MAETKQLRLDPKSTAAMVWQYWFRTIIKDINISIKDITNIIIMYYNISKILKWKVKDGFAFSDDDKCTTKLKESNAWGDHGATYRWISPDIEAVNEGIHCWRINANHKRDGSKGGWITYGVSPANPEIEDDTCGQDGVWGLAYNECYYRSPYDWDAIHRDKGSSISRHLYQKNIDVDILLNLDDGILKIGIVGKIDNAEYEYIFNGIEKTNKFDGWIPHLNLYQWYNNKDASTDECELRIVEIPPGFYGEEIRDNIFGN